jgi:hypothetical protein
MDTAFNVEGSNLIDALFPRLPHRLLDPMGILLHHHHRLMDLMDKLLRPPMDRVDRIFPLPMTWVRVASTIIGLISDRTFHLTFTPHLSMACLVSLIVL